MKPIHDSTDGPTVRRSDQEECLAPTAVETSTLGWHAEYGTYLDEDIEVRDISADGLSIVADKLLPTGLAVWINLDGDLIKCVVRNSERKNGVHFAALQVVRGEQRLQDREPCHEEASLERKDSFERFSTIVKNVSDGGLQVELPQPLPPNAPVRVSFGSWLCEGRTCYSRQVRHAHLIGIELTAKPVRIAKSDPISILVGDEPPAEGAEQVTRTIAKVLKDNR